MNWKTTAAAAFAAALTLAVPPITPAAAQTRDPARIAAAVEGPVTAAINSGRLAGVSVAVVRGRDTLLMRSWGKADLEQNVPTPDGAVYEIGSITKQFTAAAILQLQERGKLSLDDELVKYLPGIPAQVRHITLRRLMDHTSGIAGVRTAQPEFQAFYGKALPRDSLVAVYAGKPLDFEPGSNIAYNNTAYIILGLVIEKASGVPYEAYVKQNLFDRAGMRDTRYCAQTDADPRRVKGYDVEGTALKPAAYVDFRWPFSAGSLCSTTGDLVAWTRALHGGRILGPRAYHELVTPGTLSDGTPLRYAMGFMVNDLAGHRAIHHGGSIPGFSSYAAYLPDDSLTVVVLLNTLSQTVRPTQLAQGIIRTVLVERPLVAAPFRGNAGDYVGEYRVPGGTGEQKMVIARDSAGTVAVRAPDGQLYPLVYLGGDAFGRQNDGTRWLFVREGGRVTRLRLDDITEGHVLARQDAIGQ